MTDDPLPWGGVGDGGPLFQRFYLRICWSFSFHRGIEKRKTQSLALYIHTRLFPPPGYSGAFHNLNNPHACLSSPCILRHKPLPCRFHCCVATTRGWKPGTICSWNHRILLDNGSNEFLLLYHPSVHVLEGTIHFGIFSLLSLTFSRFFFSFSPISLQYSLLFLSICVLFSPLMAPCFFYYILYLVYFHPFFQVHLYFLCIFSSLSVVQDAKIRYFLSLFVALVPVVRPSVGRKTRFSETVNAE